MSKRIRISNESLNCFGTWIKTEGIDYGQFQRNPVLLWMHQRGMVVGKVNEFKVEGDDVTGEIYFDEVRDESKILKQQYDKGTVVMCSANFEALEWSDDPALLKPGQTRPTVTKCKLLEVSMVDFGGNDDAIVLFSHEGKALKLAAGEDCEFLPLLKTNSGESPQTNNPKTEETMNVDFKAIALKLGMPETATETEILGKVGILLGFENANTELRTQLDTIKLAGVTQLVDDAIKSGKFNADKKDHFIALGKTMGTESLKLTLDSMAVVTKPMQLLNPGSGAFISGGAITGQWGKLSEVPGEQLKLMRDNDPEKYRTLYKAEYGIDCPKL